MNIVNIVNLKSSKIKRIVTLLLSISMALPALVISSGSGAATTKAPVLNGKGQTVVIFMPIDALGPYIVGDKAAMGATLISANYKPTFIQNAYSQTEEDQQVQQYLGTGAKPAAFIYWPTNAATGINSARLLSAVAPVIQFNQSIAKTALPYVKMFVGDVNTVNGDAIGDGLMAVRDTAAASGVKFHSTGGNLVMINGSLASQGSIQRQSGFLNTTSAAPFLKIGETNGGSAAALNDLTALLPSLKDKGIDFIYSFDGQHAVSAVQALLAAGYTPGKDVFVVDGNCAPNLDPYMTGAISATTLQSGIIEGIAVGKMTAIYLATKKVLKGAQALPNSRTMPKTWPTAVYMVNSIPVPLIIGAAQLQSSMLWGYTPTELCNNVFRKQ